jgi:thiol-disulfide isomerase/thioredoxin
MKKIRKSILAVLSCLTIAAHAQQAGTLMEQLKAMSKETDPQKNIALMQEIIRNNKLDTIKDAETIDLMKGNVAMSFLHKGQYEAFERYIGMMKNKFNQTSYLNMGAATLAEKKTNPAVAERLARKTLDLYNSYKDDPSARPAEMPAEDWNRFMRFAYYPYCDVYAMALHANGKNKLALEYQEKAFGGPPEEGLPSSVERYATLLALTGQEEKAYGLLASMAEKGKSTIAMNALLKKLYVAKNGSDAGFEAYFNGLQQNVQATLKKELREKMLDTLAPGFSLQDLNGKRVNLSDFRGKVVVLDFWATWCMPCIASFPAMKKMVEKHPEVVFLFIATQEKEENALSRVKTFISKGKYPFHVLMDEPLPGQKGFKAVSAYKPQGIPAKVVIDGKGRQRFMSTGFSTDTELINELEAMIAIAKES